MKTDPIITKTKFRLMIVFFGLLHLYMDFLNPIMKHRLSLKKYYIKNLSYGNGSFWEVHLLFLSL